MVYLATDHTGLEVKNKVKEFLTKAGYEVEDLGTYDYNKDDDYPDFISKAAEKVSNSIDNTAIVFGGSGQGEAMVANKYPNVRCALFYSPAVAVRAVDISGRESTDPYEILKLTREHNHANVLSIGIRFLKDEDILQAVKLWLETPFSNEERHARRVKKISEFAR